MVEFNHRCIRIHNVQAEAKGFVSKKKKKYPKFHVS